MIYRRACIFAALALAAGPLFAPGLPAREGTVPPPGSETQMPPPEGFTDQGPDAYLQGVATGDIELDERDAAWLVRRVEFRDWIVKYPNIAEHLAGHPYAAAYFVNRAYYRPWADRHPQMATAVETAAVQWRAMTPEQREELFRSNPGIPRDPELMQEGGGGSPGGVPYPGEGTGQSEDFRMGAATGAAPGAAPQTQGADAVESDTATIRDNGTGR